MAAPPTGTRVGLDPKIVSRLGRLDLVARLVVEGFISGLHKSPFHGFSVEFVEHRQYMPGDPLKSIDWKVRAKSDRVYVKQYEDETNLRAHLVVDHSASMNWASTPGGVTKLELAKEDGHLFWKIWHKDPYLQVETAAEIGLGSREYGIQEIE